MKTRVTRLIQCIAACNGALLFASTLHAAGAQEATNLPYLNPQLSPEQRATDLVRCRSNKNCTDESESRNFEAADCINTRGEAIHGEVEAVYCSHAA